VRWGFESPPCYWKRKRPSGLAGALLLCREIPLFWVGRSVVLKIAPSF
jgi:hypothetical protein